MENIRTFFDDFKNGKFKSIQKNKTGGVRFHDIKKIKKDNRFKMVQEWIDIKYNKEGIGIKSIIKEFNLPITYPVLRKYLQMTGIKLRDNKEVTDWLRKKRSDKNKYEHKNKIGWFSDDVIRKNNKRGLQGYYFNKSLNKFVWLRSSHEYIYAKWLDKNNYKWDIENESYRLSNGELYKPDFFIFENDKIKKIVEIKGYWENRSYKFFLLKKDIKHSNIELIIIDKDEILNYSLNYKKDIKEWKEIRKKNNENENN